MLTNKPKYNNPKTENKRWQQASMTMDALTVTEKVHAQPFTLTSPTPGVFSFFWYFLSLLPHPLPPSRKVKIQISAIRTLYRNNHLACPEMERVFVNRICEPTMAISKNKPSYAWQLLHKINLVINFGVKKKTTEFTPARNLKIILKNTTPKWIHWKIFSVLQPAFEKAALHLTKYASTTLWRYNCSRDSSLFCFFLSPLILNWPN